MSWLLSVPASMSLDPVVAVDVMSLTFGAYELVPLDALLELIPTVSCNPFAGC